MSNNALAELVRRRIDEATESKATWNHWPNKLAFVQAEVLILDDEPEQAYHVGFLRGSSEVMRQVRRDQVTDVLPDAMLPAIPKDALITTWFLLADPRGQEDDPMKRNILALIEPHRRYDTARHDYLGWDGPAIVVELGCNHDYDLTSPYNCCTKGICKRCGHAWMVDSS